MVQPINHSLSPEDVNVYKVEPYVMAADVYANESHKGRGGWTWYTGSSGWMYQFIIGSFIGLKLENDKLKFNPCFPLDWPHVSVAYRYKNTLYKIKIIQLKTTEKSHWEMNNSRGEEDFISLVDDGIEREVTIYCSVN